MGPPGASHQAAPDAFEEHRLPQGSNTEGRARATISELGFRAVQIPYLPNATTGV